MTLRTINRPRLDNYLLVPTGRELLHDSRICVVHNEMVFLCEFRCELFEMNMSDARSSNREIG